MMKHLTVLEYLTEKGVIGMRKRMPYDVCPYCGDHIDHGELCDCRIKENEEKENSTRTNQSNRGAI